VSDLHRRSSTSIRAPDRNSVPTEAEVLQLEVELREVAKKSATAEFWQRPWRWTEQPTDGEDLDADSYDEGTRCEIVCGLVDDAIRLAAEGPVLAQLFQ
jgi:hypothetical protein